MWRHRGPLLHEFHHQYPFANPETVAISFQADSVCLIVFGLFGEYVYFHCFDCSLVSKFTNETRCHHLSRVRCDWEIRRHFCGTALKKVKAEAIFCVLCSLLEHFRNQFGQNL
jgi:hypothetical protein